MIKTVNSTNVALRKQEATVHIPNRAIDELSLSALGFYGFILDLVQNANTTFDSKEKIIKSMIGRTPSESRKSAEKACDELIKKGYIKCTKNSNGEFIDITYGLQSSEEGEK